MYVAAVDAVVFLLLLLFLPVIVCICYHYSLGCCFSVVVVAGIDVIAVGAVFCGFPNTIP